MVHCKSFSVKGSDLGGGRKWKEVSTVLNRGTCYIPYSLHNILNNQNRIAGAWAVITVRPPHFSFLSSCFSFQKTWLVAVIGRKEAGGSRVAKAVSEVSELSFQSLTSQSLFAVQYSSSSPWPASSRLLSQLPTAASLLCCYLQHLPLGGNGASMTLVFRNTVYMLFSL